MSNGQVSSDETPPAVASATSASRGRAGLTPTGAAVLFVVVVNLAVRGAWVAYLHPTPVSDFRFYFESARTLADGGGYEMSGRPTAYWPVGWPAALSVLFRVFGPHLWVALGAQIVLTTGVAVLVFLLAERITRSIPVGVVAALAWTLLPDSLGWTSILGSEPLFALLVTGMLYAALRFGGWWRVAAVGGLLGAACLVRPTVLFFPAVLCLIGIAHQRRLRRPVFRTAVAAAVMLAVVAPWTVRNYVVLGSATLVSNNGGINLWQGVHIDHGYWWPEDPAENPIARIKDEAARNAAAKRAFFDHVRRHPVQVAEHAPRKLYGLYADSRDLWGWVGGGEDWSRATTERAIRVSTAIYWLFMLLALIGLVKAWNRWRWPTVLLLGFLIYYSAVFAFFPAWDRFRYPLMPIFAVGVGVALGWKRKADEQAADVRAAPVNEEQRSE